MKIIETKKAPASIGPYSQAMISGGFVFTSGQIGIDPETGKVEKDEIEGQTRQVIENLRAVLEAAGSGLDRVVKTTCFLADMKDFPSFNAIYAEFFLSLPARSCIAAKALPKGVLVELEAVAEIGKE